MTVVLHTEGNGATVANTAYMANVLSRQEGVATATYVAAYSSFLECWD